jgi:hypothetical protein
LVDGKSNLWFLFAIAERTPQPMLPREAIARIGL